MEERESKNEAKAVPEQRAMGQEEMGPSNVTPMARGAYAPALYGRVNWGSAIGGAFVALTSWLVLNALGYAVGFGTTSATSLAGVRGVSLGVAIWAAIAAALSFFIGGYAASRFSQAPLASDGLWHGLAVWGFASIVGLVLSTFIFSGLLSFVTNWISAVLNIPNTANVSAGGIRLVARATSRVATFVLVASLLGLAGSLLGGWLGSRRLSMAEASREGAERTRMAA